MTTDVPIPVQLQRIPVSRVCPNDVIHRDGDDWLVIVTNMYSRYGYQVLELYVERLTGDNVVQQEWWTFEDLGKLVQIYESV